MDALYYTVPNLRNFDLKDRVSYGDPVSVATLGFVSAYGAAYIALLLVLGLVAFRRRDLL